MARTTVPTGSSSVMDIAPASSSVSDVELALADAIMIVGVGSLTEIGSLILNPSTAVGSTKRRSCLVAIRESPTATLSSLVLALSSVVDLYA